MLITSSSDRGLKRQTFDFDDGSVVRTSVYMGGDPDSPQATFVNYTSGPGRTAIQPHFHHVRQFQVVVEGGGGRVGKHEVPPVSIHYTDPDSPYGPIVPGESGKISFLTLRPRAAVGVYYMPGSKSSMNGRAGMNVVRVVASRPLPKTGIEEETLMERTEDGLIAVRLRIAPHGRAAVPNPNGGGGRYYLIINGALRCEGRELSPFSLIWASPDEPTPSFVAMEEGADVLILQFPVVSATEETGVTEDRDSADHWHGEGPRARVTSSGELV